MPETLCASYTDSRLVRVYDPLNGLPDSESRCFFVQLAGSQPKNILDIGCGTGLLACELADLGHQVTGADPAIAMLDVARRKPGADKVTWVNADAASFSEAARFDLIVMTGHVFQVFLDDEEVLAVLGNAFRHLAPDGQLAFDSRNPLAREWTEWTPENTVEQVDVPELGRVTVHYDIRSIRDQFVTFETHFILPGQEPLVTSSTLRFMNRKEIARSLRAAGFSNVRWHGDYKGAIFSPTSPEIIVVAG